MYPRIPDGTTNMPNKQWQQNDNNTIEKGLQKCCICACVLSATFVVRALSLQSIPRILAPLMLLPPESVDVKNHKR
jgi:hypothetical protein